MVIILGILVIIALLLLTLYYLRKKPNPNI